MRETEKTHLMPSHGAELTARGMESVKPSHKQPRTQYARGMFGGEDHWFENRSAVDANDGLRRVQLAHVRMQLFGGPATGNGPGVGRRHQHPTWGRGSEKSHDSPELEWMNAPQGAIRHRGT